MLKSNSEVFSQRAHTTRNYHIVQNADLSVTRNIFGCKKVITGVAVGLHKFRATLWTILL